VKKLAVVEKVTITRQWSNRGVMILSPGGDPWFICYGQQEWWDLSVKRRSYSILT
jgi:hypothetical protein